jgi:hypothetical protein
VGTGVAAGEQAVINKANTMIKSERHNVRCESLNMGSSKQD